MRTLNRGKGGDPISEEGSTTAAAATDVPLGTFEEEEASGVPTNDLAFITPTAASEQGVTSVGVS